MADTKKPTPQSTSPVQPSGVRFVRSSSSSLQALNSLPADEMIILFTPALPLVDGIKRDSDAEDPFECLGRAISRRHARVRHVPFVSKVGLTDLHLAWIRRASAIVIVNCEPSILADTKDSDNNMASQIKFGADVSDTLHGMRASSQIPLSCVNINNSTATHSTNYDNFVSCASYSTANMEKAAALLMD